MKYETEAAQNEQELVQFIDLLKGEGVRSYLEIGARYGGSLWRIARSMPKGSRAVAVDLPGGFGGRSDGKEVLASCIDELNSQGYDARVFFGDSTADDIVAQVRPLAPFDAVMIDAHHGLANVTADWNNYGAMARIVAFHDIGWKRLPGFTGTIIDVPKLWSAIKVTYRHQEIVLDPKRKDNGIGVLWR